jgi:hypothetical protein
MTTWRQVPGWFDDTYRTIYQEAVDRVPAKPDRQHRFVEIGILFGRSTTFLASQIRDSGKRIAFDAVDAFRLSNEHAFSHFLEIDQNNPDRDQSVTNQVVKEVGHRGQLAIAQLMIWLTQTTEHVNVVCSTGQDRAQAYPDASIDLAFVDALHTYEDTRQIIEAYLPKIRVGGILAGHDYEPAKYPGVVRAVTELLPGASVRHQCFTWEKP